ncbi:MAG: glycogen synthase GlgA [Anaerolineae bacterium]
MDDRTLNILVVSAEAVPYVKAGGLADVAGSLPAALRALGHDARLVLPHYGIIDDAAFDLQPRFTFALERPAETVTVEVHYTDRAGVPTYFLRGHPWFGDDRKLYYGWDQDVPRFLFFAQAVVAMLAWLGGAENGQRWTPDVVHANDWHAGLIPFLLRTAPLDSHLACISTLYTIHNIGYQGDAVGGWLSDLQMPPRDHPLLAQLGKADNLMAIGAAYAGAVNTVSPRYARELQQEDYGYSLDPLLRARAAAGEMSGVLNGIDTASWNPVTDPALVANFDAETLERRVANKLALQADADLPQSGATPLIGMITRLVEQKGLDVAIPAMRWLLAEADAQFVVLGTGERRYIEALSRLMEDFPGKVRAFLEFGALSSRRIYAGCDAFLMPSRYEPCGISQMIAMRYGALPVVRATGGLADTVANYDASAGEAGTGFVFEQYTVDALLGTLHWVIETYHARPAVWRRMQTRAMKQDFSWGASAREYVAQYRRVLARCREGASDEASGRAYHGLTSDEAALAEPEALGA